MVAAVTLAIVLGVAPGCGSSDDRAERPAAEPTAGEWKTWVLESGADVSVPPPPKAGSEAAKRDAEGLRTAVRDRTKGEESAARRFGGDPSVRPWLDRNIELVASQPKDVPASSRAYSNVSVAMYDAVVAAYHWKYRYRRKAPSGEAIVPRSSDPSYPSEHAAMAGAASHVLAYLYPGYPKTRLDREAEDAAGSRVASGASYPSDVRAGLELGRRVAERVIAHAKRDGSKRKWGGKRPRGPEHWEPDPGSAGQPNQPLAGTWKTWLLRPTSRFRPKPPPRYGTREFIANARDVMRVKERLTPEQKRAADFWEGMEGTALPAGVWNQVAVAYLPDKKLSVPRQVRTLALLNVAMADAGGAVWDAKFLTGWWDPRPITAIRDLGLDPRWKSYLGPTPLFPAYPSGTSGYSGAAGEVLAHLFPEDARLWRSKAKEAGYSRLWGGVHWRIDVEAGLPMGQKVGRLVVDHAKQDGAERR
ncbi:MAG: phosphatase PAP2 family protein [Actinomycetota bacterium]|nr:phosphatase PAP2 family protein [Actinomycetota bacterium]